MDTSNNIMKVSITLNSHGSSISGEFPQGSKITSDSYLLPFLAFLTLQ
jgi:hypothetical protein